MKKLLSILSLLGLSLTCANAEFIEVVVPEELDPDVVRDAGVDALENALDEFFSLGDLPKRFAIKPLEGDLYSGYYTAQLRNKFASKGNAQGIELYTRDDQTLDTLFDEIKLGQEFGDTMAPSSIQEFGRVSGIQGVVLGRLESITVREETAEVRVRITFQAYEVETGRFLWGTEATGSIVDENLRKNIVNYVEDASEEIKKVDVRIWYWVAGVVLLLIILKIVLSRMKKASRPR